MTRPNLSDPVELKEYRRELRAHLRPWRMAGLMIVIAAALWLGLIDSSSRPAWVAFIAGWAVLVVIIFLRIRYHRRRMREPA